MAGLVVDAPIDVAVPALNAAGFLGRLGDDILDDVADKALFAFQRDEAEPVIFGTRLLHDIHGRRDLGDLAGAEHMGEMLPDVDGVRMLAGCAAAASPETRDSNRAGPG